MGKEILYKARNKLLDLYSTLDGKILQQFGFRVRDVSLETILVYLYSPKDSSSLAVTRVLFGIAMLFDIPDERGGAAMNARWGDPTTCHFPLVPFITAVPIPYMALVYTALWFGALGITLGCHYRISSAVFAVCYWYLFIVEKSYWNNHSYLFGIVAVLLMFTDAHCYWSVDAALDPALKHTTVPYWNYFILKYQFFILYFMAGVKKGSAEWLTGYSVQSLSEHWVFEPFKLFLTSDQTDYLIVHWFVFAFDLTVGFWMMWRRARHVAVLFCALFHLMNSRLFSIGMFPWVCLATMPLFYPFDWPKTVIRSVHNHYLQVKTGTCKYIQYIKRDKQVKCDQENDKENVEHIEETIKDNPEQLTQNTTKSSKEEIYGSPSENEESEIINSVDKEKVDYLVTGNANDTNSTNMETKVDNYVVEMKNKDYKKMLTVALIAFHIITQAFLPFSHFITQGYNNWTNGLYGYSWDMMVHTWSTDSVVVKIVDNEQKAEFYIDPYIYSPNERWTRHGDMLRQYAHCLKDNLMSQAKKLKGNSRNILSNNVSIYIDVWCSMNGRFTQRMFDPKADLLSVPWSPFKPMSYLMPLLDEALGWRGVLQEVRREVHSWHNTSDVIFFADYPGYRLEKFIPTELDNVTLTVLEGFVVYEPEVSKNTDRQSYQLVAGNQIKLETGTFHRIINVGTIPAYYMFTFANITDTIDNTVNKDLLKLPIAQELSRRITNMITFFKLIFKNIIQMLFQLTQCEETQY